MNMLLMRYIIMSLLLGASFASEDASKLLNDAQQAVAKAYDGNLVKAQKAYDAYLKELSVAQGAVQKDLEKIKADLNDTKKFTKLSIAERAKAIEEIDGKIAELKKGALGEMVVAKSGVDMLGEADVIVGRWEASHGYIFEFKVKGVGSCNGVLCTYERKGKEYIVKWGNGVIDVLMFNGWKSGVGNNGKFTLRRLPEE